LVKQFSLVATAAMDHYITLCVIWYIMYGDAQLPSDSNFDVKTYVDKFSPNASTSTKTFS